MSISHRLFTGFALVIVLAVVVGILGAAGMHRLQETGISMYEKQVVGLEYLGRATGALEQTRQLYLRVVVNASYNDRKAAADAAARFEAHAEEFGLWMERARGTATTDEQQRFYGIIDDLFNNDYMPNARKIVKFSMDDMTNHANTLEIGIHLASINGVSEQLEKLILGTMDLTSALAKKTSEENNRTTDFLIFAQYAILGIAVLIAIAVTYHTSGNITRAYSIIDEQNKTILSSVKYASKIQNNLLPGEAAFKRAFEDSFIVWQPRDILGGDIYWIENFDEGSLLCVCDCTGHGTPGALLTMLVVSSLDNLVNGGNCRDTAQVMWKLDKRLASVLNVDESPLPDARRNSADFEDGCDIAVLFVANDGSVSVSSANINVFVCDGTEVTRIKGQKLHIGEGRLKGCEEVKTERIPFNPKNEFYIATDGLYDQIGGEHNRPFGYKAFERVIMENHGEQMEIAAAKIWDVFETYRGGASRRDDVQLVAFKPGNR